MNEATRVILQAMNCGGAHFVENGTKRVPVLANGSAGVHHFVGQVGMRRVIFGDAAMGFRVGVGDRRRQGCIHAGRSFYSVRRSSVKGNSLLTFSSRTDMRSGVWPNLKKRSMRRLSA